jgi:hypothetical protein
MGLLSYNDHALPRQAAMASGPSTCAGITRVGHCRPQDGHGIPTSLLGDDDLKAVAAYLSRHKAMD